MNSVAMLLIEGEQIACAHNLNCVLSRVENIMTKKYKHCTGRENTFTSMGWVLLQQSINSFPMHGYVSAGLPFCSFAKPAEPLGELTM